MATPDLKSRVEILETQVAEIQSALQSHQPQPKDWRRAVEKYAGDADLLAVFAAAKKLRDADRKQTRQGRIRRKSP